MTLGKVAEIFVNLKKCGQHIMISDHCTGFLWDLSLLSSALCIEEKDISAQGMRIGLRNNTFSKPCKVMYWTVEQVSGAGQGKDSEEVAIAF